MVWNEKILVGYGHRNSIEIVDYLKSTFEREIIGLELIHPEFYHLDTALFPISKDLIAVYEDAFSEKAKKQIKELGCEILYLTYKDAKEFALKDKAVFGRFATDERFPETAYVMEYLRANGI